jgi:hypothetical protein
MDFNLFEWIRSGVKNAVLLGVNDAVDSIGTPQNGSDVREHLLTAIENGSIAPSKAKRGRKKLGRNMSQIQAEAKA